MADAQTIWAAKTDAELLEAAGELFDYTEETERIIRAELRRRDLPEPDPPIGACARCGRSIASNYPRDRCSECEEPLPPHILRMLGVQTAEPELVLVLRTGDAGLIPLAKSMLEAEGIEHLVRGEDLQDPFDGARVGGYNSFKGPAEFWVRDDDAERARTLLDGLGALQPEPAPDPNDDA